MSSRVRVANSLRIIASISMLLSGCAMPKPREHSSQEVMESATSGKVTRRQAADVEIAMARSLEESGDLETAEKTYREAIKKDSKCADAEARLGILCDRKGDTKEANGHFARAASLDPNNPEILCDQGYSFYLQRRWSDAESRLKKAIKIDPHHARSHTNLGLLMARQGDEKAALAQFALAGCDAADAQSNLGLILCSKAVSTSRERPTRRRSQSSRIPPSPRKGCERPT